MAQVKLSEPAVYIRYNPDMDPGSSCMRFAANWNSGGNPAFLNDKLGTRRYLDRGVPVEDAVNWNASGCLGYHLDCMEHLGGGHNISQLKVFELALNDGFDRRTGKQLGPHTGDPRTLKTYEELEEAYYKQLEYFVPITQ
jgi:formate C-acetyltransferase